MENFFYRKPTIVTIGYSGQDNDQSCLCGSSDVETTQTYYSFPRVDECAHYHDDHVELPPLQNGDMISVIDMPPSEESVCWRGKRGFPGSCVAVIGDKVPRSLVLPGAVGQAAGNAGQSQLQEMDNEKADSSLDPSEIQLNFDLEESEMRIFSEDETLVSCSVRSGSLGSTNSPRVRPRHQLECVRELLERYLSLVSQLAGSHVNCGPVLSWLELDNRGRRPHVPDTDDCPINMPAVAAANSVRRYSAQAGDEISFDDGDMISVIDMPPLEESVCWRGKRGFPGSCVAVIGDKVPRSLVLPSAVGQAAGNAGPSQLQEMDNEEADSSLDPSEIQLNFDLEESEMRIFSEDETLVSCSVRSGSLVSTNSPRVRPRHQLDCMRELPERYLSLVSQLAGSHVNCGPVLSWLELDNRGRHLLVPDTDDCPINMPAVAAAYSVRRYSAQAGDEISFDDGDMISVIDIPPSEESVCWRGKRGIPGSCVAVIGDKVPRSLVLPGAVGQAAGNAEPSQLEEMDNEDADSSLDPSEIQMNFDLEESEMRIFSEDETLVSCSVRSGSLVSTNSPRVRPRHQLECVRELLERYLSVVSQLAGSHVNCGPVLSWLELDNRGRRPLVPDTDDCPINMPTFAAAYSVRRYSAQAGDEISFDDEDMISVTDIPPSEKSVCWRGKRGFPGSCVAVIGDKVPRSLVLPGAVGQAAGNAEPSQLQEMDNEEADSSLDPSEIQLNFDLEESEMRIFSEDETLVSCSVRSGSLGSTNSPRVRPRHQLDCMRELLERYLSLVSQLAGSHVNCGPVLSWLELDNRGRHLLVPDTDDCPINMPAVAAAHSVRRYSTQAGDEISFDDVDMISVIDIPPSEESVCWRGKRGFPGSCVAVIWDKVPRSLVLPGAVGQAAGYARPSQLQEMDNEEADSSLDPSEIQLNFDLEESEMRIFSEDETPVSCSVRSGSLVSTNSPRVRPRNQLDCMRELLERYLSLVSQLAGSNVNSGPVLRWLELDNRGRHLLVPDTDDCPINMPAVAEAYSVRRYSAQAGDEISFDDCMRELLERYLSLVSQLAGSNVNCGPVLSWLELDNRGRHLLVPDTDDCPINMPAVAESYSVRRYSAQAGDEISFDECVRELLERYLSLFSQLAGSHVNCGPVLSWLELDNRGPRLLVPDTDDCPNNMPAVAAAHSVRRYSAQAGDEISFDDGDMISVIDMPPSEESVCWRGKRGFPGSCVAVIGDKVPRSLVLHGAVGQAAGNAGPSQLQEMDNEEADSSLDPSEIQLNFDLEESEMRIFSEDETLVSCSVRSGSLVSTNSPRVRPRHQLVSPIASPFVLDPAPTSRHESPPEAVYQQVKYLRRSVHEINQLIDTGDADPVSPAVDPQLESPVQNNTCDRLSPEIVYPEYSNCVVGDLILIDDFLSAVEPVVGYENHVEPNESAISFDDDRAVVDDIPHVEESLLDRQNDESGDVFNAGDCMSFTSDASETESEEPSSIVEHSVVVSVIYGIGDPDNFVNHEWYITVTLL